MQNKEIRNFVIIAHIDHGKSTLADRMLEVTGTVESRRMRPQYLDSLDLERERGITIKMAPVRMSFRSGGGADFLFHLIDTPGHSDFSYEVSRALAAVEGAVLLIDATKGIQAQTLSNLRAARAAGLTIIAAINKIDLNPDGVESLMLEVAEILECEPSSILRISGKTGTGVADLLEEIARRVPPPKQKGPAHGGFASLIFDSFYDDHKGILAYIRVFEGAIRPGDDVVCVATGTKIRVKEVGFFGPQFTSCESLAEGQIGYIATGLKDPSLVKIGDTIVASGGSLLSFPGYREPSPVVFIAFYPDGTTKYEDLRKAFERLRLNDSSLTFEPDANEALGRGLKVGFLGQLHFEIASERLRREFGLEFLTSFPSIAYRVIDRGVERIVKQMEEWPAKPDRVFQPMIALEILAPSRYLNDILNIQKIFDLSVREVQTLGDTLRIEARMPLSELIRDFDDQIKSVSAGFASFSYELDGEEESKVRKLEIHIAGRSEAALTRAVAEKDIDREGRATVERLKDLLPREQFAVALQAVVDGKIIARETIPAMRKDVTGYLYGGDRTRKMKLWKKQARGKARLKEEGAGKVAVPIEVFREILKK